jgi:hypothetical protein
MKTRTAVVLVAAFTAGMALVPMSAKAICQQTIYAERGLSDGTNAQVLGHFSSIDDHVFFATTTNAQFAGLIWAAVAQRNTIIVFGNAATCPTTGTLRDMGTILTIIQNP